MNINPHVYYPLPLPNTRPQEGVSPVQSRQPVPDAIQGQQTMAGRLAATEAQRRAAEHMLHEGDALPRRDEDHPASRKALAAYEGVAKSQEREYVSRILGISEYA